MLLFSFGVTSSHRDKEQTLHGNLLLKDADWHYFKKEFVDHSLLEYSNILDCPCSFDVTAG